MRGMIKRALSVLLALSMVLSTTACSKKPVDTGLSDPNPQVIVENIETENIETEQMRLLLLFERLLLICWLSFFFQSWPHMEPSILQTEKSGTI